VEIKPENEDIIVAFFDMPQHEVEARRAVTAALNAAAPRRA
jgi:hypothetical protein